MENSEVELLEEAIANAQLLIEDNVNAQQALMIESEALAIIEAGHREEVAILKGYVDALKEGSLSDKEVAATYRQFIADLEVELSKINKIEKQMRELWGNLNDLERARMRIDLIILGYRQKIMDIEYSKSTKGKDYFTQRVAMSISELYLKTKSKENVVERLTSFAKGIFKK